MKTKPAESETQERTCTAFAGSRRISRGTLLEVALKTKAFLEKDDSAQILVFDDRTSAQVEIDFRGSAEAVAKRIEKRLEAERHEPEARAKPGPGRPRLGVVAREVTLLPHHWDWLASQPGGASVTLRKLVEEAKNRNRRKDEIRRSQEAAYRFMTVMAGDLPGYEEAIRALYAGKNEAFKDCMRGWPKDVREHALELAAPALAG